MDEVHSCESAGLETEGRPILEAVGASAWRKLDQQARELVAMAQLSAVVSGLGGAVAVIVVVFVLNKIKDGVGGKPFRGQTERNIDKIDGRVLRMTRGGHHADQPPPDVPCGNELRALFRSF